MELLLTDDERLDRWHRDELQRLGFTRQQTQFLCSLIDGGELLLAEVREKVEGRGWSPDQVMACYAV